jgi:hypothetical protein
LRSEINPALFIAGKKTRYVSRGIWYLWQLFIYFTTTRRTPNDAQESAWETLI